MLTLLAALLFAQQLSSAPADVSERPMRGLPTIVHEHANRTRTPWFQQVADRVLEPAADSALAVSRGTADFGTGARIIPPRDVKVVYLGVPLDEFSRARTAAEVTAARRDLGIADGEFAVGAIARLHDSKGNARVVDAAARVVRERPSTRFDLSVFPSLWEGTPITAFEALAMGRSIVSPDADGLLDIVAPDEDALIVPKADSAARASRIVWAIDRPDVRARLARTARGTGQQYDIDVFVGRMERL